MWKLPTTLTCRLQISATHRQLGMRETLMFGFNSTPITIVWGIVRSPTHSLSQTQQILKVISVSLLVVLATSASGRRRQGQNLKYLMEYCALQQAHRR